MAEKALILHLQEIFQMAEKTKLKETMTNSLKKLVRLCYSIFNKNNQNIFRAPDLITQGIHIKVFIIEPLILFWNILNCLLTSGLGQEGVLPKMYSYLNQSVLYLALIPSWNILNLEQKLPANLLVGLGKDFSKI